MYQQQKNYKTGENSIQFNYFREKFQNQIAEFQNNLQPSDSNILIDPEYGFTSENQDELEEMMNSLTVHNDSISLIYHDQPLYIKQENQQIRKTNSMDDAKSLNTILMSNNQEIQIKEVYRLSKTQNKSPDKYQNNNDINDSYNIDVKIAHTIHTEHEDIPNRIDSDEINAEYIDVGSKKVVENIKHSSVNRQMSEEDFIDQIGDLKVESQENVGQSDNTLDPFSQISSKKPNNSIMLKNDNFKLRNNSYRCNSHQDYQIPHFLLQRNKLIFSKEDLDQIQYGIDEKGLNFQFDVSDSKINKLIFCSNQIIMKIQFFSESEYLKEELIDYSYSADNYYICDVPENTHFVQIKILKLTTLNQVGFINSLQDDMHVDQSVIQQLHFAFQDLSYNTRVIANTFNIDLNEAIDSRVPIIIQHNNIHYDEAADDYIYSLLNDYTDIKDSQDTDILIEICPDIVGEMKPGENLHLLVTKFKTNNIKYLGKEDIDRLTEEQILLNPGDHQRDQFQLKAIIKYINMESNRFYDFLVQLNQIGEPILMIFDEIIVDLVDLRVFKLSDKQQNDHLIDIDSQDDQTLTTPKINWFNLVRLRFFRPSQIQRWDELDFWFLKGMQSYVLTQNLELISNQKDSFRSKLIIKIFQKQLVTEDLDKLIQGLKDLTMQDCIGSLQVDQEDSLHQVELMSIDYENMLNVNLSQKNNGENQSLERSSVGTKKAYSAMGSQITSAVNVKTKKQFQFMDTSDKFIRLIGFIFFYFLRELSNDFKNNKESIRQWFESKKKQQSQFEMSHIHCTNQAVVRKLNECPIFYLWTLQKFCTEFMDRRIDWSFHMLFEDNEGERQDFKVQVNLEKGFALVNSPHSQLFPLPAIMQFKDYIDHELDRDDLLNPSDIVKENIENQIKAFINEETGVLQDTILVPKQKNDIIQNTYFKLFDYAQELKLTIVNFLKETQITNHQTFDLFSYRIQNISPNLRIKNDLMLNRQTNYKETFEVSQIQFEKNKDDELRFNGIQFNQDDFLSYRIRHKQFQDLSEDNNTRIITVQLKVSNRVFKIDEYLLGLYNNHNENAIQDYELVRDMIDQITQKQLIMPQTVYVQTQVLTIILQLPMVYTQLRIVEPGEIHKQNQTGYLVTSATVLLIVEIFFVSKLVLELIFMNLLTNYEVGISQQTKMFQIVVTKTLISEKILSIANNAGLIQTSFLIFTNVNNNYLLDEFDMKVMLASCFICIFNLVNFMSQFSFTQKLVITLIEIFKDMRWTLFIAFVLVLCLTCTIWGIENLKNYLIDANILLEVTTEMSVHKSWISPQHLRNYNWATVMQQTISLALLGDTFIFSEQNQLISLLTEEEVTNNKELSDGIKIIKSLEVMWQMIVIIVIVGYVVVLLNFMIAIMADSQSKVTENFLMYTYKLKLSYLIEWHWVIQVYLHQIITEEEKQLQPWKIVPLNPSMEGEEDWSGQVAVIKSFMTEHLKKVETNVSNLHKKVNASERRMEEYKELNMAMLRQMNGVLMKIEEKLFGKEESLDKDKID